MSGASDHSTGLSVSSWGWSDQDGQPATSADATFRAWSISLDNRQRVPDLNVERIAILHLPVSMDAGDALMLAHKAFVEDEPDPYARWVEPPLEVVESSVTVNPDGTIDEMHLLAPAERPKIYKPGDLGPEWDIDYESVDRLRFTVRRGYGPKESVVAAFLSEYPNATIHGVKEVVYP